MALGSTLSLTENEYQGYILGVMAAGAEGSRPYTYILRLSTNSRGFGLLKPHGPVQACNGLLTLLLFL